MTVAAESRSSFHMKKCDFKELVFHKIFHLLVFSGINRPLNAKYLSKNRVVKKLFSYFELL